MAVFLRRPFRPSRWMTDSSLAGRATRPRSLHQSRVFLRRPFRPSVSLSQWMCRSRATRGFASTNLADLWKQFHAEIQELPEQRALVSLQRFIDERAAQEARGSADIPSTPSSGTILDGKHVMSREEWMVVIDAALATFCLHVQARIAALCGQGFYTIGPCGEEWLAAAALALQPNDASALHYRHVGISIARQLLESQNKGLPSSSALEAVLLARARGFTVSVHDPVTGGVHCSIGSDSGKDYIVTSTLASQCPSAVGRALGFSIAAKTPSLTATSDDPGRPVSFCTIGDGSVHNHHFLSAFSLARHARHKRVKCPVVFGISDNGLSISYDTAGYVHTLFNNDPLVPVYTANGSDPVDVYYQTRSVIDYARRNQAPAVILYRDLTRRFGHAATDRQFAYLAQEEIQRRAEEQVLEDVLEQAVNVYNVTTWSALRDRLAEIEQQTKSAFEQAASEPKVTRDDMLSRISAPVVPIPSEKMARESSPEMVHVIDKGNNRGDSGRPLEGQRQVMRKHMTRVLEEAMEDDDSVVYLGEDVQHGGYYLVTEGLSDKFPGRILDFPPDETSLLGAAMGFSQAGLTPICEIPYAKYLDCGADMFYEIAVMYWLSKGQLPNGMIIRLQGFDRGLFGGNFHTHNSLPHVPPGVDVVCYSNGSDYVRGFRHALLQAKAGRVVVSVDCTNLLNLRHLHDKDRGWEHVYPGDHSMLPFDDVCRYGNGGQSAIVSFGNGVVTALQARRALVAESLFTSEDEVDVIDCPFLSGVPRGLEEVLSQYDSVVFADICKAGPGGSIFSSMIPSLHQKGLLPRKWQLVAAPRTYNPLGNYSTFLNVEDIVQAFQRN